MSQTRNSLFIFTRWPFTQSVEDLSIVLVSYPFLWLLGLEQFFPYLVIILAAIKLLFKKRTFRFPIPLRIMGVLILWQWVSYLSIDLPTNRVVFFDNWLSYLSGLLFAVIITNTITSKERLTIFFRAILFFCAATTVIGILFIAGFLPDRFTAPVASIMPTYLKQSTFVQDSIIQREIGRSNVIFGGLQYNRVSSIFLFPGSAAAGYLTMVPIVWFVWYHTKKNRVLALALLALLMLSLLVFAATTTRTALILLPLATASAVLLNWLRKLPNLIIPAVISITFSTILLLLLAMPTVPQEISNQLFVETRGDSLRDRLEVYTATFESIVEHPIVGWGTPRKIESVKLAPAGTHGEYIFVLYSYGMVGLVLFLLFLGLLWIQLIAKIKWAIRTNNRFSYLFYAVVALCLFLYNMNAFAHGSMFDTGTMILSWSIIGLSEIRLSPELSVAAQ